MSRIAVMGGEEGAGVEESISGWIRALRLGQRAGGGTGATRDASGRCGRWETAGRWQTGRVAQVVRARP